MVARIGEGRGLPPGNGTVLLRGLVTRDAGAELLAAVVLVATIELPSRTSLKSILPGGLDGLAKLGALLAAAVVNVSATHFAAWSLLAPRCACRSSASACLQQNSTHPAARDAVPPPSGGERAAREPRAGGTRRAAGAGAAHGCCSARC